MFIATLTKISSIVRVAINNATDLCFEQEQPDVVEQFPVNENDPTTEIDEAYEARQKATDPDDGAIATLNQLVANCVEAELGGIEGYDIVIPSDLLDLVREELELGDQ